MDRNEALQSRPSELESLANICACHRPANASDALGSSLGVGHVTRRRRATLPGRSEEPLRVGAHDEHQPRSRHRDHEYAELDRAVQDEILASVYGQVSEHRLREVIKLEGAEAQRQALQAYSHEQASHPSVHAMRPRKLRITQTRPVRRIVYFNPDPAWMGVLYILPFGL